MDYGKLKLRVNQYHHARRFSSLMDYGKLKQALRAKDAMIRFSSLMDYGKLKPKEEFMAKVRVLVL